MYLIETPAIDRTIQVTTRSGLTLQVNRIRYNIAYAADGYVQCMDGSWGKARNLLANVE